jgi:hypothetical protein
MVLYLWSFSSVLVLISFAFEPVDGWNGVLVGCRGDSVCDIWRLLDIWNSIAWCIFWRLTVNSSSCASLMIIRYPVIACDSSRCLPSEWVTMMRDRRYDKSRQALPSLTSFLGRNFSRLNKDFDHIFAVHAASACKYKQTFLYIHNIISNQPKPCRPYLYHPATCWNDS